MYYISMSYKDIEIENNYCITEIVMNISQIKTNHTKIITIKGNIGLVDLPELKDALNETAGCREIRIDLSDTDGINPEMAGVISEMEKDYTIQKIKLTNTNEFLIEILKRRSV